MNRSDMYVFVCMHLEYIEKVNKKPVTVIVSEKDLIDGTDRQGNILNVILFHLLKGAPFLHIHPFKTKIVELTNQSNICYFIKKVCI